jgi:hypothetical protein
MLSFPFLLIILELLVFLFSHLSKTKRNEKEVTKFTGFNFDDKLLNGLKADFDNYEKIKLNGFFNKKMAESGKKIQNILFIKEKK